ncbi:GAF domain-containing protein [Alteromonas sp. 1_MG-2023]|uniref:GAF domain-containing protein n=1 Tax=Alteromonas sp. 1_MG-2023 TaxID=3062669 RepID=UPI0026E47E27|nr:GAF domain-containing protein [Alteromonas sp. 1_MG-2023]MDO6565750.1 GAF domain-containing protein [Alteromonas sp. 1_MG-2023]
MDTDIITRTKQYDDLDALVENCEKEALHLSGKIQQFGAAFFIENESLQVTAASSNLADFLNISPDQLVGSPVKSLDWLPLSLLYNLGSKAGDRAHAFHEPFDDDVLNFRSHRSDEGILIEIEASIANVSQRQYLQLRSAILPTIEQHWEDKDFWGQLVSTLDEFLPCERILLYRFNELWSGEVVAEKVIEDAPKYIGLKFPASDIPAIARKMYFENPSRYIASTTALPADLLNQAEQPLNLTYSDLRSVSPIHAEYMQNMGVGTSFSIPIIQTGKLWGIISCHNSAESHIDAHLRNQAEMLVKYFSMVYSTHNSKKRLQLLTSLDEKVGAITHKLRLKDAQATQGFLEDVKRDFTACGAAIYINGQWFLSEGDGYDTNQLKRIDKVFQSDTSDVILHTQDIRQYKGLNALDPENVRGVMLIRMNYELAKARLYVFRQPEAQITHWAGKPEKDINEQGTLSPRASFERWSEVDGEQSIPWTKRDILFAKKLRASLIRTLTR